MQTKGDGATRDPVCGRLVERTAPECLEYRRRTYFFCSARCRERFERQVERHRVRDLARMGALLAGQKIVWGLA